MVKMMMDFKFDEVNTFLDSVKFMMSFGMVLYSQTSLSYFSDCIFDEMNGCCG